MESQDNGRVNPSAKRVTLNECWYYIETIAQKIRDFQFDCTLLVCGFDKSEKPYIILLEPPGVATDCSNTGFQAIGIGWEKATSELLYVGYAKSHRVARTLYDCFDAKVHAELAPGVGEGWEMRLITASGAVSLRDEARPLLDQVSEKYSRSPFENRKAPKDWKLKLQRIVDASLQRRETNEITELSTGEKV